MQLAIQYRKAESRVTRVTKDLGQCAVLKGGLEGGEVQSQDL